MSRAKKATACLRSRSRAAASFAPPARASLPASAPIVFACRLRRSRGGGGAQAGQCDVLCSSANGSARCRATWAATRPRNIWPISAKPIRSTRRKGLGHPGLLQRVMNKVLVDNAILGPWIHVGSRMQLLSAARSRRRIDRARESDRQLRQEGPPLRRTRRAGGRQRQDAAGALPPHRDLPAARAGGGVGTLSSVIAGLDPAIHHASKNSCEG